MADWPSFTLMELLTVHSNMLHTKTAKPVLGEINGRSYLFCISLPVFVVLLQVYEGVVYMDFSKSLMESQRHGQQW